MEGITVLHQFEVITETAFSWTASGFGALIAIGVAFIVAIIFGLHEQDLFAFFFMFGGMCVLLPILFGTLAGHFIAPTPVAYETHYEVLIDEEINLKEFMDKYDILETRGDIYTVREKIND